MDEDSILELVTQYLRSKNLSQTAEFLWKEKEDLDREEPDSLVGSPETAELSRSLLRILKSDSSENTLSVAVPFSGRKIDSHGENIDMLAGEDIEYQGEAKSEELLQEKKHRELGFDDNSFDKELEPEEVTVNPRKVTRVDSRKSILSKSPSFDPILKSGSPNPERKAQIHFSTEIETTEVENDVYLDTDDLDETEHRDRERDGEYETPSRGSRTSSILRSRTGSTSSARSSNKSVSFVSSSEDEEEEEEDLSSDEWSDDDDPGYVKVPIEALDYFQYSEDEEPLDHEEQEIEDGEDEELNYKFKNMEFVENPENEDENENDEWELPATQDESHLATQEGINSGIPPITAQQLDQSQEELEFEKLNQILRKHIQTQKDEYYQEWNPEASSSTTNPSKIEMRTSLDYHTAVHGRAMDRQPPVFESTKSEPDPLLFETKTEHHTEPPLFESNPTEPTEQPDYPIHYESFNLPIICESGRTGLQESKDFPIEMNTVIAGRYQILEYLGSAAFSKAIRCHDLTTEHQVCIKIIKNNKEFLDQSLDEIRLLQYINASGSADEKNVLQLYDYFYFKEHLFIVTELLRDNLYEFYKYNLESGEETYFTIERLKRITKQCLVALEFVHSLNLIHCDLKPENILIKSYSRCEVKIIDFGSSCFTKDHLSSYVQSRSYRAPEVILGYPYNSKIDLWSLGCILAELWTGKVLFHNESIPTLLARTVSILGPYDPEMLKGARYAHKYFTKTCSLYEKKQGQSGFTYLKPKRTTLKARLKTEDDVFVDFVSKLLAQNPSKRLSATEALQHPFLKDAQ